MLLNIYINIYLKVLRNKNDYLVNNSAYSRQSNINNETMWRIFGYKTYPAPSPSVKVVKISTLSEVRNHKKALKITDMEL